MRSDSLYGNFKYCLNCVRVCVCEAPFLQTEARESRPGHGKELFEKFKIVLGTGEMCHDGREAVVGGAERAVVHRRSSGTLLLLQNLKEIV